MKNFQRIFGFFVLFVLAVPAQGAVRGLPSFDLEKKIAYQQGQFGALYAHCGAHEEQAVIGGSLASWRVETFQGYAGNAEERAGVERAFDDAASAVIADSTSCQDWVKQAAATWHSIIHLSQYGTAVASAIKQQ